MESQAYEGVYQIEEDHWWYHGRRIICFGLLERFLLAPDLEILDVGCGTGYNLELLKRFGKPQGVDMAPEALEFCRRRGVENVTLHQAGELPFPDQAFDLVTAFDVIEHIDDDGAAMVEFKRVLRPGGTLLIYTPALPWLYGEHDRIVHHKRRYMKTGLRTLIEDAGFGLLHLSYVNLLVLPGVLLFRLLFTLLARGRHLEMGVPPGPINRLCGILCELEKKWVLERGLPLGMSLAAVARKPYS